MSTSHVEDNAQYRLGGLDSEVRFLDGILASLREFVYVFDRAGQFVYANQALLDLWGLPASRAIGQTMRDLDYPPDVEAELLRNIDEVIATRSPVLSITHYTSPTGTRGSFENALAPLFTADGDIQLIVGSSRDVTERFELEAKREETRLLEAAIQVEEARRAFLLRLSDALRPLSDPIAIKGEASRLLGEELVASRCHVVEIQADVAIIENGYLRDVASLDGRYPLDAYDTAWIDAMRAGRVIFSTDTRTDPAIAPTERAKLQANEIGAYINLPLVKDGQLTSVLAIQQASPRRWSAREIELVRETAERTWTAFERARAEAAVRESEERFRLMADSLPQLIWMTDTTGNVEFLNRQWVSYSGMASSQLTAGQIAAKSIHPDDAPQVMAAFSAAMRAGRGFEVEQRNRSASGEYRWFLNRGEPFRDPRTGEIVRWIGSGTDIHDRKLAEAALRQAADRDQFRLRLADALRTLADPLDIQAEAARVLGEQLDVSRVTYFTVQGADYVIEHDYVAGVPSLAGHYPIAAFGSHLLAAYRAGEVARSTDTAADPDLSADERAAYAALQIGSYIGVPLVKDGQFVAGLAVHGVTPREWTNEDVLLATETAERTWAAVERARAEATSRESEARLQMAIEASGIGTFTWYVDDDRGEPDARASALLGLPANEMTSLADALTTLHPADRTTFAEAIHRALDPAGDGTFRQDARVLHADGSVHWIAVIGQTTFAGTARHAVRMSGTVADITERKLVEERERRLEAEWLARSAAEQRIEERDQFIAIAAHELRTPVTAVLGNAELLRRMLGRETADLDRARRLADSTLEGTRRMVRLVQDLLDVTRLQSQRLPLRRTRLDLAALVARLTDQAASTPRPGLTFAFTSVPTWIDGDADRLDQVVTNLLDNAVKYSPSGGTIRVDVGYARDAACLTIADEGIGLTDGMEDRLFRPFGRATSGQGVHFGGIGLGLFLCRQIVEQHGGTIHLSSGGENQGTTVVVEIPLAPDAN